MIRTLLIDDEPKALSILKNKINRYCPNLKIIGEAQNPQKGIELIIELKPELVFLDISMPELNGFQLLQKIESPNFELIFQTAHNEYGIEAIKHCAIGYLVKPLDNEELILAVARALENIKNKTALVKNNTLIENLSASDLKNKKLAIPTNDGLLFVHLKDIIHFEGDSGYTKIHLSEKKTLLSSHSIGYFVKMLDENVFYPVHKSYLINLDHLQKYLNEGYTLLTNNHKAPVSRNRRNAFLQLLKER